MDSEDHVGTRLVQVLIAAVQLRAAEIGRAEVSLLQHGPHGPIEDENAFFEGAHERPLPVLVICHTEAGVPAVHCSVRAVSASLVQSALAIEDGKRFNRRS